MSTISKIIIYGLVLSTLLISETHASINYRQQMRSLIQDISTQARSVNPDFLIIPQNGLELLTVDGVSDGEPVDDYIDAIDGVGQEDLFYGYENPDQATSSEQSQYLISFLNLANNLDLKTLVIDYCSSLSHVDDSYRVNSERRYVSFAADHINLDNIPNYPETPFNESNANIENINDVQNFLYLINPENFPSKDEFLQSIRMTNYDLVIIDLFFEEALSRADVESLKQKANGSRRLVVAYISIGEAEDYRYYWQDAWEKNRPSWLLDENPDWEGNFLVKFWDTEWQDIIFRDENSYLDRILDAGFDGAYLDLVDAFENFEN
jgi:cysteinyl-tRNA synthetase, unknown class